MYCNKLYIKDLNSSPKSNAFLIPQTHMYCERNQTITISQKTQQHGHVPLICFIRNENLPLPTKLQLTEHQMITDIKPFLFIFQKSIAYFDCKPEDQYCFVYPNTVLLSRNSEATTKPIIETFKCGAFCVVFVDRFNCYRGSRRWLRSIVDRNFSFKFLL